VKIAVLTLTRDRLDYTQHCFDALQRNAGCLYDHHVLDQGSTDGTRAWLTEQPHLNVHALNKNLGVGGGINYLLDKINPMNYDVIVTFDNDCELTQPNTIRDLCSIVDDTNAILSPRILGLNNPPPTLRRLAAGDDIILETTHLGAICRTAPAWVFDDFRFPDDLPLWGGDEGALCGWFREKGGTCGYVERLEAWHYEGTDGQHERFPEYFERRVLEGGPV
jgi:GT2 family glycosyltransferase